jgi:hypothetical protein
MVNYVSPLLFVVVLAVPVEMMEILSGLKEMLRTRPS